MSTPTFTLNNGLEIPALAYGIGSKWSRAKKARPDEVDQVLVENITKALKEGFVHLDMAETYNTYPEVKAALAALSEDDTFEFKRENYFITDKYWTGLGESYLPKSASPKEALDKSLEILGLDYVDAYLIHSPFLEKDLHGLSTKEAWKQIEDLYRSGKAKSIGVSNFDVESLKELLTYAEIKPTVNQIEYNAYLQEQTPDIVKFCQENDILVSAYSPLAPLYKKSADPEANAAKGPIDDLVADLATKYGKTSTQILLRWVFQTGVLPVTTSQNEDRIRQILDIWSFALTQEETDKLSKLGSTHFFRQYWLQPFAKYEAQLQK